MSLINRSPLCSVLCAAALVFGSVPVRAADSPAVAQRTAKSVRSLADLDFGFEEPNGNAQDAAVQGASQDVGEVKNGIPRADSPFWGQEGRRAILLNAARKQVVQIPDGPDLDRPNAVSVSFFFLSLHPLTDANFHGLVAKRSDQNGATNYGINYHPANDALQFYINDGGGFRSVVHSVKEVLGTRRLVHLTATWEVGDAPGSDADTDPDDVRVRLFVNGQPAMPKSAANGQIVGHDGWLQDINIAGLVNDVPVTIGSSTPTTEFTSGLIDELLLFDLALTGEQAAKLFEEVAGPKGGELAQQEAAPALAANPKPAITATSLNGLKTGQATRLTITGTNLAPNPRLILPGLSLEQKVQEGSNANRLNVEVALPENSPLGWFPLFVETDHGLGTPLPIAIDTLTQQPAGSTSPEKPAALPAAFSGQIAGANTIKIYFQGQAGQRIAAEVEAKRLGAAMDPVVEIKTDRGTPVVIGWGETALRGDARAECQLSHDGLYFVELHDLTYRASGQNRFRIKVGDFRSVDQWFPAKAAQADELSLKPVGAGLPAESALMLTGKWNEDEIRMPKFLAGWEAVGPLPALPVSQATEVMEAAAESELQTVDATFQTARHLPVVINGVVAKRGEEDRFVLNVTPGQKLRFAVEARSLPSPLDALLTIRNHPKGDILIYKEDSGTARDPVAEFAVPDNVNQIQVVVQDLHERGGERFVYRLKIVPADAPDFDLKIKSPSIAVPAGGTAVVEMTLSRRGYAGPIQLRVVGEESISLEPDQIPAGAGNRELFVTLAAKKTASDETGFRGVKIVGQSVGLSPDLVRTAEVTPAQGAATVPGFQSLLPVSVESSAPFQIKTASLPAALFKGVPANIKLSVKRQGDSDLPQAVRLTLLTTEPARPNDPKDPKKGNKPKIRSQEGQAIGPSSDEGRLRIAVPADVAVPEIDAVIKAELVPHAYSGKVAGVAYSHPFKIPVKTAAKLTVDNNSLNFTAGQESKLKGTLERTPPFKRPLTINLAGLPAGYQSTSVTVPPNQTAFEVPVKPGPEAAPKTIKANLQVKFAGRSSVLPDMPVELKITPASQE